MCRIPFQDPVRKLDFLYRAYDKRYWYWEVRAYEERP